MKRSLLYPGFVVALLILLGASVLTALSLRALLNTQALVTHTLVVLETTQAVLSQLTSAETAQRGYVITGQELYLEAYQSALGTTDEEVGRLQTLRQLTADNVVQQYRLDTLEPLVAQKLTVMQTTMGVRRTQGLMAAVQ